MLYSLKDWFLLFHRFYASIWVCMCVHTHVYKNGMMIYVFVNISLFSLQRFILILLLLFELFGEEIFKEQLDTDGPLRHSLGKGQDFPFPTQVFVFQDASASESTPISVLSTRKINHGGHVPNSKTTAPHHCRYFTDQCLQPPFCGFEWVEFVAETTKCNGKEV